MQKVGNSRLPQVMSYHGTDDLYLMLAVLLLCFLSLPQHHRALDDISLPSLHTHSDDIQSIIHRIKSTEIANFLQNKYPEKVRRVQDINQRMIIIMCSIMCAYDSVLSLWFHLPHTGLCSCRNTGEAFPSSTAAAGKHQAAACQCVCEILPPFLLLW